MDSRFKPKQQTTRFPECSGSLLVVHLIPLSGEYSPTVITSEIEEVQRYAKKRGLIPKFVPFSPQVRITWCEKLEYTNVADIVYSHVGTNLNSFSRIWITRGESDLSMDAFAVAVVRFAKDQGLDCEFVPFVEGQLLDCSKQFQAPSRKCGRGAVPTRDAAVLAFRPKSTLS